MTGELLVTPSDLISAAQEFATVATQVDGLTKKIVSFIILPDGKDVNDLTKEEFSNIEESMWIK